VQRVALGRIVRLACLALLAGRCGLTCAVAQAAVAYKTEIAVPGDDQLAATLTASSLLVTREKGSTDDEAVLIRRANADLKRLQDVTSAAGYYDAKLSYRIDKSVKPWRVKVDVALGEPYRLREVRLVAPNGGTPPLAERFDPAQFGLQLGARATSASIVEGEGRILAFYASKGRPLAKMVAREAVIDRADHSMHVTFTLDAGPPAVFGPTEISGLKTVDRRFVERRLGWHEGELYDGGKVEQTQQTLIDSNLFATVKVRHADKVGPDGRIAMRIELSERRERSIGFGVYYDTSLGLGSRAYWEHRNLFGEGENLHLEASLGQSNYGALAQFRRPYFLRPDLDFRSEVALTKQSFDAYDARQASIFAGIDEHFSKMLTGGAGLEVIQAHVTDDRGQQDYALVGAPLYIRRDTSDDLLNPTRGTRLGLTATPYTSIDSSDLTFVSAKATMSAYQRLGSSDRFVLAGFANVGSINGVSLDELPRDLRLYVGGGGSVRGYGYQQAGPLDGLGNPIGGLSSLEVGLELRSRITETIGVVGFIEGGNVYAQSLPDLAQDLFWGTGVGLRYYSPIGPVRLDLATPLDKRPSDSPIQFYISLGQAF
jgi:translocation and assembly module TamA